MLTKQVHQKIVMFVTISISQIIVLTFNHISAINRYHNLLMMSINFSNIAILKIKGSDYRCIISLISKNEAINLKQNDDLTKKWNITKHKEFVFKYKNGYRY